MFCTTECWDCNDKSCKYFISKSSLYFKNKDLQQRIDKAIEYIKEQELLYYSGTDDEEQYSKFSIDLLAILGSDK